LDGEQGVIAAVEVVSERGSYMGPKAAIGL
jgi:hypothetical protein